MVLELNREAYSLLRCTRQLDIVPGARTCSPSQALWKRWPGWPSNGSFATWFRPGPESWPRCRAPKCRGGQAARHSDPEGFPMLPIKTILHPTDFSKPSEYALRFACALARDYQARLVLLHVVEPPVYYGELGMSVPLPTDFHENLQGGSRTSPRRLRSSRGDGSHRGKCRP